MCVYCIVAGAPNAGTLHGYYTKFIGFSGGSKKWERAWGLRTSFDVYNQQQNTI